MSKQAEGRWGEQGAPLQRRASRPPAEVCGSLPPAPSAPPGRAELEKEAGAEGGGAGATGQTQTGSKNAVT